MHDFVLYGNIPVCILGINLKVKFIKICFVDRTPAGIALIWKLTYLWELITTLALTMKNGNLENGFVQMFHIISEMVTPTTMTWPKITQSYPVFHIPSPYSTSSPIFGMNFMFL